MSQIHINAHPVFYLFFKPTNKFIKFVDNFHYQWKGESPFNFVDVGKNPTAFKSLKAAENKKTDILDIINKQMTRIKLLIDDAVYRRNNAIYAYTSYNKNPNGYNYMQQCIKEHDDIVIKADDQIAWLKHFMQNYQQDVEIIACKKTTVIERV